mgnify:CR=1 FL=1
MLRDSAFAGEPIVYKSSIALTEPQKKIHASKARFKYVKAGRRFGKTKYGVLWQIEHAIKTPGTPHWYITPTQKMAHEIAWDEYIQQLDTRLIVKAVERDLTIEIVNGSKIYLKGSDKIDDTLRGRKLGSVVLDEAAYHRSHVFPRIVEPMLIDLCAPALFISTPKKSWFSQSWLKAKAGEISDAEAWHFTVYDNPWISRAEIARVRANTTEDVWQQEYMANELEYCGKVYTEFQYESVFAPADKFQGHTKEPCVVGADWGLADPTGVAWLHFLSNGLVVMSAEHVKSNWDTHRHAEVIKSRSKGRSIAPGCMVLDQSAFRREGSSGNQSVADSFRREGVTFVRSDKDIDCRLALVKRYLRGNDSGPWLYVSGACRETITAFNDWEHGDHEPDILAAIGYALALGVKKRMSRLIDIADVKFDVGPPSILGNLAVKKGVARWEFDCEYGTPP